MKYKYINDGDKLEKSDVEYWDLNNYIKQYQNIFIVDFVGFIIKRDEVLLSFPKKYDYNSLTSDEEKINILKKIIGIVVSEERSKGSYNINNKDEFPYKAYFDVMIYYKKYGLHFHEYKENKMGYAGNINWNKTFKKSEKHICDNNIIFMPFVINKKITVSNFISECMDYILTDVYLNYSKYLEEVIMYNSKFQNNIFENYELCYKQLLLIKNNYFKDIERKLIVALINYFKWKSEHSDSIKMITTKFETYWEMLINSYLNDNFVDVDENYDLVLNKENKKIIFEKKSDYIEHDYIRKNNISSYSIEFDHLYINYDSKTIYLFDSKYFNNDVSEFNYKQAYYYYHLKNIYQDYKIYNGLILPTDKDYYSKIHVDRDFVSNINIKNDGLKIVEYYLNLNDVIEDYLQKYIGKI